MIDYSLSFKNRSIDLDGAFVKQLFKFCSKDERKDTVLGTPWYNDGKIYATDSVRITRLTLNDRCKIDAKPFSFSADACAAAKKGMFDVSETYIQVKGKPSFENPIIYADGNYPNADKLFPKNLDCVAEPKAFNATFMADICALAASVDKNMPVKFSFTEKLVYFEFNTKWGKCDGVLMPIRMGY